MTRFSSRALKALFGLASLVMVFGFGSSRVFAQTPAAPDVGLQAVGQTTVLSGEDPRVIVVRIINIALSLIGIILVSIILYAGFLWMTSGGDTSKIEKAKMLMRNAIIGVVIIVSSWAITRFILKSLTDATGGGGSGQVSSTGPGGAGGSFGGAGISGGFYLEGIEPGGTVSIRNIEVRFLFSQAVTAAQVGEHVHVTKASGEAVPGRFTVDGSLATFVPSAACPAPAGTRFCFDSDTDFIAKVDSSMRSGTGQALACGGLGAVCEGRFRTGDRIDVAGPSVSLLQPYDGQSIPQNASFELIGSASDENGISLMDFLVDGRSVDRTTPPERTTPTSFEGRVTWNTTGVSLGSHRVQVDALDIDSNRTSSTPVSVVVRADTCFDERQNGDETAIDCGGTCGACTGSTCRESSECSTGVCSTGRCVERPVITAITPNNGRIGTIVTISGSNFGTSGEVVFAGGIRASVPSRCSEAGSGWSDEAIIVEVPVGATTGVVSVKNAASGLVDTSDDEVGPRVGSYTVNTTSYPGLCAIVPNSGSIGTAARLLGGGFGSSSDRVQVGEASVSSFRAWSDGEIGLNIPTIAPGTVSLRVRVGEAQSNPAPFTVEATRSSAAPVITGADPASGPVGQYITLRGEHFGDLAGVIQVTAADGRQGPADTAFPAACDLGTRYWSDTAVTFKIPATVRGSGLGGSVSVTPGSYQVFLQRREDASTSNQFGLTVVDGAPGPGLCALSPDSGPTGTEVRFTGERFGSEQGVVRFQGASGAVEASSILEWTDQSVRAVVPAGSRTGSVLVRARNEDSNGLPYSVRNCSEDASICSTTERCCEGSGVCVAQAGGVCPSISTDAHYAWRMSTGELPIYPEVVNECNPAGHVLASPSPWDGRPGGANACINADLVVRFSTMIDAAYVNGSSFIVRQCSSATGDCSAGTVVAPAIGFPRVEASDSASSLIRFRPASESERWSPSSFYQVILSTAIRSDRGIAMPAQTESCGAGNAYCFRFGTRASTDLCTVGSVIVNPGNYRFDDLGMTTDAHANPLAADDVCLQLNAESYAWTWTVRDRADRSDARVSISTTPAVSGQSPDQTATANAAVPDSDPSLVTAAVTVGRRIISGNSEMSVALRDFKVEAYGPDCDAACINAAVWAQFTTPVQIGSVIPANIEFRHCSDADCRSMDDPFTLPSSAIRVTSIPGASLDDRTAEGRFLLIRPTPLLRAGEVYHVLLRSGVRGGLVSTRGQALTSLNNEAGFAWKFKAKTENDGRCTVDRVILAPDEKIEQVIGARQRFTAVPVSPADACSASGELLVSESPYAWSVVNEAGAPDASVARLIERTDGPDATSTDMEAPIRAGMSVSDQQLADIVATRDPGTGETRLTTNVQATYQERSGKAVYGLQCGQRSESLCPSGSGLTGAGCCAPRPQIVSRYPAVAGTAVCRNTDIFADFQVPVDIGSATSTILLAKNFPGTSCPENTQLLERAIAGLPTRWYTHLWDRVVAFFHASPVSADVWCVGEVPGTIEVVPQGTGSRVLYHIQEALAADTEYRIYVRGARDLATVSATSTVIRSDRGVAMQQESTEWTFRTGSGICQAQAIEVTDTSAESPYLFTSHPTTHEWRAVAKSYTPGGVEVPITPVREYAWTWGPWISSKTTILTTAAVSGSTAGDRANVLTNNRNGQSFISARFDITRDDVTSPSTSGTVFSAAKTANVTLCERPWPGLSLGAFTDDAGSASLRALAPMFATGPFYHFSTLYCMDAGMASSTEDDLPSLRLNPVPLRPADTDQGILRQYLFTFTDPALRADGIGIRIASNPLHLSAAKWYASKGFTGTPQAFTVDGYDAVRDGATVYISGSDLNTSGPTVGSVIYILSRNPDAKEQTSAIFDQLVQNFVLNTNLTTNTENVCVRTTGSGDPQVYVQGGRTVSCSADWECAAVQPTLTCASDKAKLQRDRARIGDVQTMNVSLETYRATNNRYPALAGGSYLQGLSTSRWPSWEQTLGADIGGVPPRDPVNRYTSCGRCQAAGGALGKICSESGECSGGETCVAMSGADASRNGFDPATCWNQDAQRYLCPAIQDGGQILQTSHVYQYRAIDNGGRYELGVNLEAEPANAYRPPLLTEIRRCSNTNALCTVETDCRVMVGGVIRSTGTCRPTGGSWLYGGICENTLYTASNACSPTGELGPGQVCRAGETRATACSINGQAGTKVQVCSDCREFVDSSATVCTPNVQCGNGRIDSGEACDDGLRNGQYGFCSRTCQAPQGSCGDGVIASGETCDNGSPVGSPAPGAPGVNGAYCGVGCNVGQSCSLDCRAPAPHCGDAVVDPTEQCDGNTQQTAKALCVYPRSLCTTVLGYTTCRPSTSLAEPCDTDADCSTGGRCGTIPSATACGAETSRICSGGTSNGSTCTSDASCGGGRCVTLTYPTFHVRSCNAAGSSNQCSFATWSSCRPLSTCGDGVVDTSTGEECDDGISGNSGSGRCTPRCKLNACGDGFVQAGREDCDFGGRNGVRPSVIEYGSVGEMCSNECRLAPVSGGFCGNGVLDAGESCDGTSVPVDATCRSLGFDYGTTQVSGRDALSCNSSCSITGCQVCSARLPESPSNTVTGVVRDGILQNRPLRQARVSLRYNGATIAETYTDDTGHFRFGGIHDNAACGNYTITISLQGSKYNYTTRTLDRTADPADGYYPFTSAPFSFTTFRSRVGRYDSVDQVILLAPRPGEGETIVMREWNSVGSLMTPARAGRVGQFVDPQLILPRASGYNGAIGGPYAGCVAGSPGCRRTVNWEYTTGTLNMTQIPHAGLACYEADGDSTCASDQAIAETIMYRRSSPVSGGVYRYFLVDFRTGDEATDGNIDTAAIGNRLRIVWRDSDGAEHYQELSPSSETPRASSTCKKYWYAFDQDAVTGRITIVNRFMCNPPGGTAPLTEFNSITDDRETTPTGINLILTSRNDADR